MQFLQNKALELITGALLLILSALLKLFEAQIAKAMETLSQPGLLIQLLNLATILCAYFALKFFNLNSKNPDRKSVV